VHHRYTAQIGVDNAYSPMTVEQYRAASAGRRLYYRFMRSIIGQPFFYMIDIWLPKMFLPSRREAAGFRRSDWVDLGIVYAWLTAFIVGLAIVSQAYSGTGESFAAALANAALFGFLVPFLVWNLFISFVTIVQHTAPRVRWVMPTGRPSTHEQKLRGTVHIGFPEPIDWFFHRVMQHMAHHVNPMVPLYTLKGAEKAVMAQDPGKTIVERWSPAYHWRMARDCKLYDPERDGWCDFDFAPTGQRAAPAFALSSR
jgi:omega-6 fatty acid desaturase (delta-12 desaturase)